MNAVLSIGTTVSLAALFACTATPTPVSATSSETMTEVSQARSSSTVRLAIPMHVVEPAGRVGAKVPTKRIVGNCGTAFLYLSRVDNDATRAVYGFDKLKNRSISYSANATFINEDTDHVETDHAAGNLRFRKEYQREATRRTGSGTVTVYAHITARKATGGSCASAPGLNEQIFIY